MAFAHCKCGLIKNNIPDDHIGKRAKCPKCKDSVVVEKDKAVATELDPKPDKIICPKCKHEQPNTDTCVYCGVIIEKYLKSQTALKKEDVSESPPIIQHAQKQSNSLSYFLIIIILGASWFGYTTYQNKQETKRKLEEGKINSYISDMFLAKADMILSTTECLGMCEEYSSVWREAISAGRDFNVYLSDKRIDFKIGGRIDKINSDKKKIEEKLEKLSAEPIDKFKEAHKELIQLFGVYSQIHSLANTPMGSLQTYNAKINDLASQFTNISDKLKILIPKIKSPVTTSSKHESAPIREPDSSKSSSSKQTSWYEGGTLHSATVGEWNNATSSNKLATAADWALSRPNIKTKVTSNGNMDTLRPYASELAQCVESAARVNGSGSTSVTELVAGCIVLKGW